MRAIIEKEPVQMQKSLKESKNQTRELTEVRRFQTVNLEIQRGEPIWKKRLEVSREAAACCG